MNIIKELYVIPDGEGYILYAPLKHTVISANKAVVALLRDIRVGKRIADDTKTTDVIDHLKKMGIIDSEDSYPEDNSPHTEYMPTNVTFLPTSDCNLRCIYCYADAGKSSYYLSIDAAKVAVDFIIANAKEKGIKKIQVGFLGGGEPFLAWDFVTDIVDYTRTRADDAELSTLFTGVTNGMLSREQVLWLSSNFQFLNISLDGTKEIQDRHRPCKHGGSSYDNVVNTVKMMNELEVKYAVRSTISSFSLNHMFSILDFFMNDLGVTRIHFEPLFTCGRCRTNSSLSPNPKDFADNFKECLSVTNSRNVELFCSAIRLDNLSSTFCGASGENFYVTPEGYVTSCTEVSLRSEPIAKEFFIGKYDRALQRFIFWNDKKNFLSSRSVSNMRNCQKCIAKWHCAGGCPAKAAHQGNIFDGVKLPNCAITRDLTEFYIKQIARGEQMELPRINVKLHPVYDDKKGG